MNNFIINQFNDNNLVTIIWKGRPCWIARQIADLSRNSGKTDPDTLVNTFLRENDFLQISIDYETLTGIDMKNFKDLIGGYSGKDLSIKNLSTTNHLNVFYKSGLLSYLESLGTDLGKQLIAWINKEVFPSIRQTYIYDDNVLNEKNKEVRKIETVDNFTAMKVALDSATMFNALIDEVGLDNDIKLIIAKELFSKIGIDVPIDVEITGRKKKLKKVKSIVETSKYKSIIDKMLLDEFTYQEISDFLKSKGENISKSTIGRYALDFQDKVNSETILDTLKQGGNSNE